MDNDNPSALIQQALALHMQGKVLEAQANYRSILLRYPKNPEVLHFLGVSLSQQGDHAEGVKLMDQALALLPSEANLWNNRARALLELGKLDEALESAKVALSINPSHTVACDNVGTILMLKQNYVEAYHYFSRAVVNHSISSARRNMLCCMFEIMKMQEENHQSSENENLSSIRQWYDGELLHMLTWLSDWKELALMNTLLPRVLSGESKMSPYIAMTLYDEPHLQLQVAIFFAQSYTQIATENILPHPLTSKIKIGYYSADFCYHPMASLIPEVIENHNRNQFEIYLFSLRSAKEDEFRQRLRKACDHFIEVDTLTDSEVVHKSRNLKIDIAIDLMGYTGSHRHGIFVQRCAPIQASWIGMPATSGSKAMDYIIADPIVIPVSNRKFYSEQVVHLPCYWPNDSKRKIAPYTPTRLEANLPEDAFVFCCFNLSCKILPQTFYGWMRIMAATPHSVLWLIKSSDESFSNLCIEAELKGISARRLIVANKVFVDEHLARHSLVDLVLDSFPYGAHTTAVDALWTGVPILTRSGKSFASRVASSFLHRIGLPELITETQSEFEARAIFLANEGRSELDSIRNKLLTLRKESPLFDGASFAIDLEKAYMKMYKRSQDGLSPDFISVV